jgi:uncharacterized protein (TIGR00251 family)
MTWFKVKNLQVELSIFVKPNAKRTALLEINNEQGVIIALHAKPKDGEANRELINFLSEWLAFPKSAAVLTSGEHSRHKKILVPLSCKLTTLMGK